ncbi:MAG: aminotransferase class V-fold PLP-dependent enzyme [Drouetiella hepatica Uher 2000/2452]|jgi:L-cysteine/cystine lyase|uniref:Aminotransferase class V-fold PLP-dependent enzyme n=1 Tax=Drouetiella hepatica Uher 2000/2452 TaxID=904376 RepID=A0A951UM59_9CYAN|nr:aminotransferase class V-fold PLP-dependent enzyme [Drouetiella hepatica Uher 2000/2452]
MTSSPNPLESSSLESSLESSSSEPSPLEQHRQQFPALANKAYFNYGGQGAMPQSAIAAILSAHEHIQQIGPFSSAINDWVTEEMEQMRETIATELGAAPGTIALTEDVSVGCNIAMWGIDWQTGDHLLLSDCEHPGIIAAALEIQRRFGAEVTFCPLMATLNEGDPVTVITQNLRPTTRLVVVSHILWNTGQVLPIAEIARACHNYPTPKIPVRLLVDAAQSVGVMPLNLSKLRADFYAFTGHKWWCGPAGIGGLYIHPEALSSLSPTFIGWRGVKKNASGYPIGWMPDSRRFEVATSDYALFSGLREAIALQNQWGSAAERFERILALSLALWQKLSDLPHVTCLRSAPPEAGLVSFKVDRPGAGIHSRLVLELEQQSIFLRTIQDPDCVRACVHYLTLESEIDRLVEAIQKFE